MVPQLFPDRENHSNDAHVITIGNFDGVHRGHQHLINAVIADADARDVGSAVLTFDPLPLEVLRPTSSLPRLNSTADRLNLIRALGVDVVISIRFSHEVAAMEPAEFVRQVVDSFHPVEIVVGSDFAFGHNRSGNPELLRTLGPHHNYEVRVVDRIGDGQTDFSSSRVREYLANGDVRNATDVLGRPFFLRGTVIEGQRRGRDLGFPTANLAIPGNIAVPADGIYAAFTQTGLSTDLIPSMVYVGSNPTFDGAVRTIEVNLLEFNADLYGSELTVLFVDRVRGDRRFDSAQALIEQMQRDQSTTVHILRQLDDDWPGDVFRGFMGIGKGALTGDR